MGTRNPTKSAAVDAAWARLASRAIRVALARRDVSYAQLAEALAGMGLAESARSVEGKIQRGTFRFTFFLQALAASNSRYPEPWAQALRSRGTWEHRASMLIAAELATQPWLDPSKLSQRLNEIGVHVTPETLESLMTDGTFSAALFLQCATVCRFRDVQFFLDSQDLNDAAIAGASIS